ncbi:hypothetical protein EDB89DRAFT_1543911 [Lactarius sanguifluus]|nr:hypothetical protein EDB89DRAFT_1543911 [Lactarius sanguifluus]
MVQDYTSQVYRPRGGCIHFLIPTFLDMFALFEFAAYACAYALVALAVAASLAVLRHRVRQRSLQRFPGPSNPSLFWGKLCREENGSHAERTKRPLALYVQPLCLLVPRWAIQDIRKSNTRQWFFGGTSYWQRLLTATERHTQCVTGNRTSSSSFLTRRHATTLLSRPKPYLN